MEKQDRRRGAALDPRALRSYLRFSYPAETEGLFGETIRSYSMPRFSTELAMTKEDYLEKLSHITDDPVPPILNNADIEWVSLYLGREPYRGISQLSEQWLDNKDFDGNEFDVHLYKIREMENSCRDPVLSDAP